MRTTLKLTAAQRSALECAGLGYAPVWDRYARGEALLLAGWRRNTLRLPRSAHARELVLDALIERSNAEDAHAYYGGGGAAERGAALALSNLANKIE